MPPNECARGVNFRCSNMYLHALGGEQPYVMTLGSDLSPSRSSWITMLDLCAEEVMARLCSASADVMMGHAYGTRLVAVLVVR